PEPARSGCRHRPRPGWRTRPRRRRRHVSEALRAPRRRPRVPAPSGSRSRRAARSGRACARPGSRRQATFDRIGGVRVREALRICARREHLRRTIRIALVVGTLLTLINQLDVILGGDATAVTWVKAGLNYCVPFVVSNLGLLARKPAELGGQS